MAKFSKAEKSKNQFTARQVSKKTGRMISWIHITDDFARSVVGVASVEDVTPQQAIDILPRYYDSPLAECVITDLTTERPVISPEEF